MPKILTPLAGTNESVLRPIVSDIANQIFALTNISPQTSIFYPGDLQKAQQPNSGLTPSLDTNIMPFTSRLSVEVEEVFELEKIMNEAVFYPENLRIFHDESLEVSIKPVYSASDVTLNFKYRANDKDAATRWRNEIRAKVAQGRDVNLHSIIYHYLIPKSYLVILKEIHRLRELVAGYGQTYDQYFNQFVTARASILTNLIGGQPAWAISEKQMRIVGYFDWETAPEVGSREDEGDTWTVSFSYKFKYDRPVDCAMFYPMVIHNQMLSPDYYQNELADRPEFHNRTYSSSALAYSFFEVGKRPAKIRATAGVNMPSYDEFIPASIAFNTMRVATLLVNIDPAHPLDLFSLRDMGEYNLTQPVLDFMVGEASFMTKPLRSVFTISLYKSKDLYSPQAIMVNSALDVKSVNALSLRNYYHVRLGVAVDWSLLDPAALDRLREWGNVLIPLLDYVDPSLRDRGLLPSIYSGNYIRKNDLNKAIDGMTGVTFADGQLIHFNTITTIFVESHHANTESNN